MRNYSTSEIVRIIGIHPNTVMLYEKWGYTAPVERKIEVIGYIGELISKKKGMRGEIWKMYQI